jgi:tungstate transport system substrate-binding protein
MLWLLAQSACHAQDKFIVLASTTSTEDSGLFKHLLPLFKAQYGIDIRVVAQGTGQALATARRGDADVVLVHDAEAEQRFVADGFGVEHRNVMYNDFVLVGPKSDPAKAALGGDFLEALRNLSKSQAVFLSRGDKSGTHSAELRSWKLAGVNPTLGRGSWYRETGSGMGATLNIASAMNAYTLTDRGTWLSFRNRGSLNILIEGDPTLRNQYGVMLVNPEKHPHVKKASGMLFVNWITSPEGQAAISSFKIDGQSLFFATGALRKP